jgi:ABC-type glycerol-3-phosphate transport system substrate-binding protein
LARFLEPASTTMQFNTANDMLITNKVALVSNWTYGIKVVRENAGKKHINIAPDGPGRVRVLGGDVLAIPMRAPHPERAVELIERLVDKPTQRTLADRLFWAPVRADVYDELSSEEERKEHFRVIREALQTAVMRPITPEWGLVEEVLNEALQDVLRQGRAAGREAEPDDIEALLRPHAARLQEIPGEYIRCKEGCPVAMQNQDKESKFEDLARDFNTTPDILAKVNGRNDWKPVSRKNLEYLLIPRSGT